VGRFFTIEGISSFWGDWAYASTSSYGKPDVVDDDEVDENSKYAMNNKNPTNKQIKIILLVESKLFI